LLEQNASFIIFPIFLIINKSVVSKSTLNRSLNVFVITNVVLAIYVWSNIYSYGIVRSFEENTYYKPVLRFFFSRLSGMHLPYLGMLFVFSCLILFNQLLKRERGSLLKKIFKSFVLLFLLISVFTFAARQALIIFFIISFFIIIFKSKTIQKKILILTSTILISIPLFYLPSVKIRIDEMKQTKLVLPAKGQKSDEVNFRYGIYNCTFRLIKQNWLSGVGPENVQKKLDECYSSYTYESYDDFRHKTYNTHNQFFDILLKFGIFGIFGFILYIFWGIKNNLEYYYIFISLCILSMLTENILNRQVGIVFFNFFNCLFFVEYLNRKRDIKFNLD
jgi:O-antigen ligase